MTDERGPMLTNQTGSAAQTPRGDPLMWTAPRFQRTCPGHLPAIRPVGPPPLRKNRAENLRAMDDLICALQTPNFNKVFVNPPLTNRATLKYAFSHVFQGPNILTMRMRGRPLLITRRWLLCGSNQENSSLWMQNY